MLGRVFDGLGRPIDGCPRSFGALQRDMNGDADQSFDARVYPRDFIQTGISALDGMNTLVRGQKLPIFWGNGLPHNRLAAQIVRQAKIISAATSPRPALQSRDESFAIVFAGMGVKYDVARFFIDNFEDSRRPVAAS